MGIRTILYGYETRDGQKAIRESEAETVRLIFRMYLSGFSYHKITEALNKRNIPYGDAESPWNKARVKRILEDRRYAGENGYPKLIAEDTLRAVQNAKAGRLSRIPPTQTEPERGTAHPAASPLRGMRNAPERSRRQRAKAGKPVPEMPEMRRVVPDT